MFLALTVAHNPLKDGIRYANRPYMPPLPIFWGIKIIKNQYAGRVGTRALVARISHHHDKIRAPVFPTTTLKTGRT